MQALLSRIRWFFTGLRIFFPLVPGFTWIALCNMRDSTVDYWKDSQSVVDRITNECIDKAPTELTSDYDPYPYWVCYSLASFLYLLGWLSMSWLTVEAFRLLISWIF